MRKMRRKPNHPEHKYLEYLVKPQNGQTSQHYIHTKRSKTRRSWIDDERKFIEFLRVHKWEWRHYYEEYHPGRSVKQAGRKFINLYKKIKENPNLPFANTVLIAKKKPPEKCYIHKKNKELFDLGQSNKWTEEEKELFIEGLEMYGRNFFKI